MKPKRRLIQVVSLMLSGVSLISILLMGLLWINFETNRSARESVKIRQEYIDSYEESISLETNRICDYMEAQRQSGEIDFFKQLKNRVEEAFAIINNGSSHLPAGVSEEQARKLILNSLRGLTFDKGRGHYFIIDKNGKDLLHPGGLTHLSNGASLGNTGSVDYSGKTAFQDIIHSVKQVKAGFFRYNFINDLHGYDADVQQIAFLKFFEPYDWIVGAVEAPETYSKNTQQEMLSWSSSLTMPTGKFLAIINYDGDVLVYPDASLVGRNIFAGDTQDFSPAFRQASSTIIRKAKAYNKNLIRYSVPNIDTGADMERLAYFRAIPSWRWVVVTGVYFKDLEKVMAEREKALKENVRTQVSRIAFISISMLMLIMFLSKLVTRMAQRSFDAFFAFFNQAGATSTTINPAEQPCEEFAALAKAANRMIKQRTQATRRQRESELKFKTIFDVSPQMIVISDMKGILLDANDEFVNFSGKSHSDSIGHHIKECFPLSDEDSRKLWTQLNSKGSVIGLEVSSTPKDSEGVHSFLIFSKTLVLQADTVILSVMIDISALKTAEKEKLALQKKLSQSQKMEAMGLMAAEVAHDLNNILSGIIGYPQLLLMEPGITKKQADALTEILKTGKRAAAVVSDLLTIARGVASTKSVMSVNSVVETYVNSPECKQLQEIFPNVTLKIYSEENVGNIYGSPVHLSKVLMNLISNAFEAMPQTKKDAVVEIKTEVITFNTPTQISQSQLEEGKYILLSVSDNGPGIPKADLEKIFEPFYSKKIKGRSGTGLGLAIVWNTIKDHHGHLDVQSSTKGTSFNIYLPLSQKEVSATPKTHNLDNYKGAGQRILVVDDVDIQRKLASKMLTTLGYEAITASSGEKAIEFLKQQDVDLVILDMIMNPGINGRETYAAIMEFKPQQKAIIASGMAETEEVAKAQALGAGQFINKPYTIEDIALAVHKALSR